MKIDFLVKEIKELRKLVAENVYKGNRANELEKIIVDRYGVSARKAKFLANQETSLLTSKYTQEKYRSAGVEKYVSEYHLVDELIIIEDSISWIFSDWGTIREYSVGTSFVEGMDRVDV